ncbi:MAG: hypothetical protein H0U86_00465 [Chloroflexi bacterium]|nr:hypothetical protein [Chloroflexota bacterium]
MAHQAEHRGEWGDVEWKGSAQQEPDDFYATATEIRDVTDVENWTNLSVNEAVCQYGRASNQRSCSLDIQDVSQECSIDGVTTDRLVMMNGTNNGIDGDSGGGWSFATVAYGSDVGWCFPTFTDNDVWSVADLYQEAIGVTVRQ